MYGLVEEMHSLEARAAAGEVVEVESVIDAERDRARAARGVRPEAMWGEDQLGRSAVALCEELAIQKSRRLEPVLNVRRQTLELAQLRYTDSRMWSERMKTLIQNELSRVAVKEERRMQAASDDRHLAQRRVKTDRGDRHSR